MANHREYDAEGDNASPMAFTQSFPASTTACPPPTQATPLVAGSRLSLLATAENERSRGATRTRSGELSDSTPFTKWTRTSPLTLPFVMRVSA